MTHNQFNRRRLMQLLAATMVGSVTTPLNSFSQPIKDEEQSGDDPRPVYIPPGKGKQGKIAVNEITFKLNKEQTSGNLGSVETTLFPGYMGAVPHRHKSFDEVCRVLQGSLTIMVGEEIFKVEAGGWHLRPRGVVHSFWNSGKVQAKFIELYLPGGMKPTCSNSLIYLSMAEHQNQKSLMLLLKSTT